MLGITNETYIPYYWDVLVISHDAYIPSYPSACTRYDKETIQQDEQTFPTFLSFKEK